jgi:putative membrane protein
VSAADLPAPVPASGVPRAAPSPAAAPQTRAEPQRTAPLSVLVGTLQSAQGAILPSIFLGISSGGAGVLVGLGVGFALIVLGTLFAWLSWRRLTYTIGAQDIRVERGIFSRSARSVPYERIQDVSLEQALLPRLFGLVSVKFETGAGGGEDLSLAYLAQSEGERLRQLVREQRNTANGAQSGSTDAATRDDDSRALFAMGPRRLFTFGLFEFSLAVFAVLAGLLQYADNIVDFDPWDRDRIEAFVAANTGFLEALGRSAQIAGALAGLIGVFLIGSLTGMVRVFLREWGFTLERTPRGFRRRRGLLTRTDVVMPIHRVQGIAIGTGLVRYRFGWHRLSFISLAQDNGASSHVVAPFATLEEIAPIARTAGFELPGEDADWRRASGRYLLDGALFDGAMFLIAAVIAGLATHIFAPELRDVAIGVPIVLAGLSIIAKALAWRFHRHALDAYQVMVRKGVLAPRVQVATRLKLHSVEVAQGPIARLRGYAHLYCGQAGGAFSIPGIPVARAYELRAKIIETIAATDFSQLESQSTPAA